MTRLAALQLLGVVAVIQLFVFPGNWPEHLLWASGLLLLLARGPGMISLDFSFAPAHQAGMALKPLALRRVRLGTALIALLLLAVLSTALVIHLSWSWTARRNIESVVASLNGQTADAVEASLITHSAPPRRRRSFARSSSRRRSQPTTRPSASSSFSQYCAPTQHCPGLVSFPDGRFFGSHATTEGTIEMVEIGAPDSLGARTLRRDIYAPIPGDIFFKERIKGTSQYEAKGSPQVQVGRFRDKSALDDGESPPERFRARRRGCDTGRRL